MKDQSEKKKKELCSKYDRLIKNIDLNDAEIGEIITDMFEIDTGLAMISAMMSSPIIV